MLGFFIFRVSSILFYLFFLSVEQVIEDKLKKPTVKNMFDDDDEYEGGINIQVAKQRMMEEDKFDKQLFRERIKQKHKVRISDVSYSFSDLFVVKLTCEILKHLIFMISNATILRCT